MGRGWSHGVLFSVLVVLPCALVARQSEAFSVLSSFSEPCHDSITIQAGESGLSHMPVSAVDVPDQEHWKKLRREFLEMIDSGTASLDDKSTYLLFSLVLGARVPDTDGHSITNLEALRMSHADPSGDGQYKHASRAAADDYEQGDGAAVEGARLLIAKLIDEAEQYLFLPSSEQNINVEFYLDFYGKVRVPVWAPLYLTGQAIHTLQDSFSHSIRSEDDNLHRIAHVLNYVDAIHSGFDDNRDGLAHSDFMDNCANQEVQPVVDSAVQASTELLEAVSTRFAAGTDNGEVTGVLDDWLVLLPGCTVENDFCGNTYWLAMVRKDPTGPYLKTAFGCSSGPAPAGNRSGILRLLVMLFQ